MIIGIDVGGTYIKGAGFEKGKIIKREKTITPYGGKEIANKIIEVVFSIDKNPEGVGIGIPGIVYEGKVVQAPNLKGFEGFEIEKYLREKFKFPFFIDNDANCALLGEKYFGYGKNLSNFIVITLGTGVGGGIFCNGKILRGKDKGAGEIGHITVFPGGIKCNCGKRGCLEAYASKEGFKKILKEDIEPEEVAKRLEEGILKYKKVFYLAGKALGIACGNLVNIFNPEAIIFTGGISKSFHLFKGTFFKNLKNNAFPHLLKNLKIKVSKLGDDAGVLGAIALFMYEKSF
jgi:glucokinase